MTEEGDALEGWEGTMGNSSGTTSGGGGERGRSLGSVELSPTDPPPVLLLFR